MGCIFCDIVKRMRGAEIIYEDQDTLSFLDRFPLSEGHTLVIPKRHAPSLLSLSQGEAQALMIAAQKISRALVKAYGLEGFNLILNDGLVAGQGIPHVHVHVVPRVAGDGISTPHGRYPLSYKKMQEVRNRILPHMGE